MITKIKYDTTKENEIEIDITKIVAVVSQVHFYTKDGKIRKAKSSEDLCLAMTIENGKVKFNRKLKFYE